MSVVRPVDETFSNLPTVDGSRRHATVFVSRQADRAVIVAMHCHEGVYVEDEDAASTETPLDPDSLGTLIRHALGRSAWRAADAWQARSPREWPAFRASRMRPVTEST